MQIIDLKELPKVIGNVQLKYIRQEYPSLYHTHKVERNGSDLIFTLSEKQPVYLYAIAPDCFFIGIGEQEYRSGWHDKLWYFESVTTEFLVAEVEYGWTRFNPSLERLAENIKPQQTKLIEKVLSVESVRHGFLYVTPIPHSWDDLQCTTYDSVITHTEVKTDGCGDTVYVPQYAHFLSPQTPLNVESERLEYKKVMYTLTGKHIECNGEISLKGRRLAVLNNALTMSLVSGEICLPGGTVITLLGVCLIEWVKGFKPIFWSGGDVASTKPREVPFSEWYRYF